MYEAIRLAAARIQVPYDLVFIVYSDQLAELPAEIVERAVVDKLEKAGIFNRAGRLIPAGRGIVEPKENNK
jgi:hypothetical protein